MELVILMREAAQSIDEHITFPMPSVRGPGTTGSLLHLTLYVIFSQCFFLPGLFFFLRERKRVLLPNPHPLCQAGSALPSRFLDHDPPGHGFAGDVEGLN